MVRYAFSLLNILIFAYYEISIEDKRKNTYSSILLFAIICFLISRFCQIMVLVQYGY